MINFLNLQYFLVLCEEMNFRRAAQKLHITQQSLSGHINKLETSFGVPLFDRKQPLTLTPAGMYLRKRAAEFLAMQDDLQKELLDIGGMIGGSLPVGSTHARSQVLLPAAFRAFQEKYPQVSVKLFEGSTDELENGIRNGTLDVSIGYLTEGSSQITTIPLYEENIIVVIPETVIERYFPNHTILSTRKPDLSFVMSCLESCPFLAMTQTSRTPTFTRRYLQYLNISPNIFLETKNVGTLLSFCSAGLGVSIFPETFITYSQYDFSHLCFYTIEDYDSKNIIVLNYRNTRYLSKTIQAFVNTVREVVDAQTGLGANR